MSTLASKAMSERQTWRILTIVSLLPAVAYLLILALAVVFEVLGPASWLVRDLLNGTWSIPLLWLLVIGGPIISVIGNLILQLSPEAGRSSSTGLIGIIAWILLLLCLTTCLPFPWLFFVGTD
jgi:hypothetical protein